MTVKLPRTTCCGKCKDIPVRVVGDRMEIIEWVCDQCGQQSVANYDLDLVIAKDDYSEKLMEKFLGDRCFRGFCTMYARFKRLPFVQIERKYKGPSAAEVLLDLYGLKKKNDIPDYITQYLFHRQLPGRNARTAMNNLLKEHGDNLLFNEPKRMPGYTGGIVGNNIPDPRDPRYRQEPYPLRENWHALNRTLLSYLIQGYLVEEKYEIAAIIQRRIDMLSPDMPDYSRYLENTTEVRKQRREQRMQEEEEKSRRFYAQFDADLAKPVPEMPSGYFQPYPHPVDMVFYYHDFDGQCTGVFRRNEERYYVGDSGGYQIFKLQIEQARKAIKEYGHAHYLIRSKRDPGENCIVIMLLENGDTVVNAFYVLNIRKMIKDSFSMPIRKNQDMEAFDLAIKDLLTRLLPSHFKLDLRPGVCDEE